MKFSTKFNLMFFLCLVPFIVLPLVYFFVSRTWAAWIFYGFIGMAIAEYTSKIERTLEKTNELLEEILDRLPK